MHAESGKGLVQEKMQNIKHLQHAALGWTGGRITWGFQVSPACVLGQGDPNKTHWVSAGAEPGERSRGCPGWRMGGYRGRGSHVTPSCGRLTAAKIS